MQENLLCGGVLPKNFVEKGLGERYFQKLDDIKEQINQVDAETGTTETANSVKQRAIQVATFLQKLQVTENDVVALSCKTKMDASVVILGALFVGAQIATLDPDLDIDDFQRFIIELKPKVMFCDLRVMSYIEQLPAVNRCPTYIFKKDLSKNSVKTIFLQKCDPNFTPVTINNPEKATAFIILTEGETAPPKLVKVSHYAAHLRTMVILQLLLKSCRKVISYFSLMGTSKLIVLCASFEKNIVRILAGEFCAKEACRIIHAMKIEQAILGTNYAIQIAKYINECEDYDLSCLKQIIIGGAPTPAKTLAFLNKAFSQDILNIYGVAECGAIAGITLEDVYLETLKPASCGKVFPYGIVKIVSFDTGKPVGPDTWGELCYSSDSLATGYVVDCGKHFLEKGFFRTGDVAQYDDQGCIYIHGRFDDILFHDNKMFSTLDVDDVLSVNVNIVDSFVYSTGKELVVYIVVNDPHITTKDISRWLADRLPEHMRPSKIHLVKEILKTRNGKVKRYMLNRLKLRRSFTLDVD